MNELPDLTILTSEQKDALIRQLFPLLEEVRKLTARVSELEARLSKNSQNSSKPPRRMACKEDAIPAPAVWQEAGRASGASWADAQADQRTR